MKHLASIAAVVVLLTAGSPGRVRATDGQPVVGFGANGVLTDALVPGARVDVTDVVDDDDGRLVVAGSYSLLGEGVSSMHWFVVRYLRNGTRDPSFATNGFLELPNPSRGQIVGPDVATFPDRSIIVGGEFFGQCGPCTGLLHVSADGTSAVAVGGSSKVMDVAELPDRRIAMFGRLGNNEVQSTMAILPSGAIDASFAGRVPALVLGGSILSTRNGLLASAVVENHGEGQFTCALLKFDASGNLDPHFAGTGKLDLAAQPPPGGGPIACQALAQADGRTLSITRVSAGTTTRLVDTAGGTQPAPWPADDASAFLPSLVGDGVGRIFTFQTGQSTVTAVHPDKSVDPSFGPGGSSTFPGEIDGAEVLASGDLAVWGGTATVFFQDPRPLVLQLLSLPQGSAAQPPVLPTTKFVPLPPKRILDTRQGLGAPVGKVPGTSQIELQVAGNGGVPPSGAVAVVLNVTATETAGPGFVTVYPTGASRPTVSNLNVERADQTVPNLVTVRLGDGGRVSLFSQLTTHLVADVAGYYVASPGVSDGRFHGITPRRILDTRAGIGAPAALVPQGGRITLQVLGIDPVPTTGVSAVVLNVTATEALLPGFVTVWPGDGAIPEVSNLNILAGETRPNLVIVPLAPDGSVSLFTSGGAHLIADLAGWFTDASAPAGTTGLFVPLNEPTRILDTRQHSATPYPLATRWDIQTAATSTLPPHGVGAVAINATTTETLAAGFVTLWPASSAQPVVSNLNTTHAQQSVPNAAIVTIGANRLAAFTTAGGHLIVDVTGWYTDGS